MTSVPTGTYVVLPETINDYCGTHILYSRAVKHIQQIPGSHLVAPIRGITTSEESPQVQEIMGSSVSQYFGVGVWFRLQI